MDCHTPNFFEHIDVVTALQDFMLNARINFPRAFNLVTKIMASLVNYIQNITSQITI